MKTEKLLSFINITKHIFIRTIRYIIPYLPRWALYWLLLIITILKKGSHEVHIVKNELRKLLGDAIPEKNLEKIAIKGISNHKMDLFEIWSFPRLNRERIHKFAYLSGKEHIDHALKKGKGALIGVSHFGSWKIIIAALAYEEYKVNQIGLNPKYFIDKNRPKHHNVIMEMEHKGDMSLPANFIYLDEERLPRKAFKALYKNELVINNFDGFIGSNIVEVPFLFGRNRISTGPIRIALKTRAPLLPTFAVRQQDGRHEVIVHEEIILDRGIEREESILQALEQYKKLFEEYVSRYPSHYCRTLYDRIIDPRR